MKGSSSMSKVQRKIMFNEDNTHQFCEYYEAGVRPTPEIAKEYIAQYAGTQVTDYLINVNSMNSSFPSKYLTSYDQKYLQKEENGVAVDYTHTHMLPYYQMFIEDHYDMYAHWIELLRQIGIRPWLSFRMNDCHNATDKTSYMLCDYFHEHPEFRRTAHHGPAGYFDNCFDYAHPEIRERMLNYIDEALDRYDVDGVELDYMREMFCFSVGGEVDGRQIMTDFVRDVRKIMAKYDQKRGKKMPLLVRVAYSPELCYDMGFDVVEWAKEKLVDIIVASPRWCPTDNDIPVEFWKRILAPYDVEFAAATELILCTANDKFWLNTHETALASCFQHLSAGADFAYLFNYMRSNVTNYNDPENYIMYSDLYKWDNYQHLLRNAGEYDTAIRCVRRHVPTYHDMQDNAPRPFPDRCDTYNLYKKMRIRTGDVPADAEVLLVLGCARLENPEQLIPFDKMGVYINSHKLECCGTEKVQPEFTLKPGYCYRVPVDVIRGVNVVELTMEKDGVPFDIDYAEIRVLPKNPR